MTRSARCRPVVLPLLAGLCAVAVAPAEAQQVPQLTVGRLTGEARPVIDGVVDDDIWSVTEPYSTFTQQEPLEGQPATERTDVWFLLDQTNLYVAVVAHDSEPDRLVVTQSRRDANLSNTDSIQILLDTFNDGQNAFVFGTNPFGIEFDGQVMAEGQVGGRGGGGGGGGGSQRGQLRGFNANWDADFTVQAWPGPLGGVILNSGFRFKSMLERLVSAIFSAGVQLARASSRMF
ncbi:MAG: carbohydrate binding family 9 domain-containing protein, partial [Vicinamibacterales bacterium]|nr:carbohydrate binding family 9 domain-containing protein [Vicinamibacterales bacterium]